MLRESCPSSSRIQWLLVATLCAVGLSACSPPEPAATGRPSVGSPSADGAGVAPTPVAAASAAPRSAYPPPATMSYEERSSEVGAASGYPAPRPEATAAIVAAELPAAIAAREVEPLARLLGWDPALVHVPGGGSDRSDGAAVRRLLELAPSDADTIVLRPWTGDPARLAALLSGVVRPEATLLRIEHAAGWGTSGQDEVLFVQHDVDGPVVLHFVGGIEVALAAEAPVSRRVVHSVPGARLSLEIPSDWHARSRPSTSQGMWQVTSYAAFDYLLEDWPQTDGFAPGQTKIELLHGGEEPGRSLAEVAEAVRWYGDAPEEREAQRFELATGQEALLARLRSGSTEWATLFVEVDGLVYDLTCYGDQAPCEPALRSMRIEPRDVEG